MKLLARIVRKLEEMGASCALIGGERIPIVDAADLILLKIDAGGLIDLIHVELLLRHDPSLRPIVESRLESLPRGIQSTWRDFLPRLGPTP